MFYQNIEINEHPHPFLQHDEINGFPLKFIGAFKPQSKHISTNPFDRSIMTAAHCAAITPQSTEPFSMPNITHTLTRASFFFSQSDGLKTLFTFSIICSR